MKTIFLLVLAATPALAQLSGKIEAVDAEGREITIAGKKQRLEEDATAIIIAGKPAKRAELKPGMQCKVYTRVRMRPEASGRPPATADKVECN